jgi:transcriptional regulator with XRE-family HTH domain
MSYFGRNIRKIRTAKNISQTAFADLFNLKRSSIGAYEEGRAEAKIDKVIEIAEYFKLSLDQLLKKELTFNEIYKVNEKSKKFDSYTNDYENDSLIPVIGMVHRNEFMLKYDNPEFLRKLDSIQLIGLQGSFIAYEFQELYYKGESLKHAYCDLYIAARISPNQINSLTDKKLYILLFENSIKTGRIRHDGSDIKLITDSQPVENIPIKIDLIKAIWEVCLLITRNIVKTNDIEFRLQCIENKLNELTSPVAQAD